MEPNWLLRFLSRILAYLESRLKSAVKSLVENRPVAFGLTFLLFAGACFLGYVAFVRTDFYQRTVEKALAKRTENTPQTYKAIEALILSNAETDSQGEAINFKQTVEQATFSTAFLNEMTNLDKAFVRPPKPPTSQFDIARSDIYGIPKRQQDSIITETGKLGFLFLPVRLLHLPPATYQALMADHSKIPPQIGLKDDNGEQSCQPDASVLCDDVIAGRNLLPVMKAAIRLNVTTDKVAQGIDLQPTQVYYITENGLNRIVSKEDDDNAFYRNQFRASTVFQDRPYYVQAFAELPSVPGPLVTGVEPREREQLGEYFYVSEPYLDIGGNGIVVTLARAFKYPDHSEGVICFDLRLSGDQALGQKLITLVANLKGDETEVTCNTLPSTAPDCKPDDKSSSILNDSAKDLEGKIQAASNGGTLSEVIGAITFLGTPPHQPTVAAGNFWDIPSIIAHSNDEVRFAVPLGPPKVKDASKQQLELKFLTVVLNVGRYLTRTALIVLGALTLLGLAIVAGLSSWAADAVKRHTFAEEKRKLHLALDRVSTVMLAADTPYVRLDATDHIVNGNMSLVMFFGLPPTTESFETKLKGTRFEDWIAGDD